MTARCRVWRVRCWPQLALARPACLRWGGCFSSAGKGWGWRERVHGTGAHSWGSASRGCRLCYARLGCSCGSLLNCWPTRCAPILRASAGSAPLVLRYAAPPKSSSRGASAPTTPRATAGPPLRGPPSTMRHACSEPSLPHPPAPQQPPPPLPYSAAQAQQAQPLPLPLRLPSSTPQPGSAPMATAADRGAATPSSASSNASSASSAAAWHLAVKLPGPEELHAVEEEEGDEAPADPTQPAVREGVADLPLLRPSARPFEPQQGQACG